MNMARRGVSVLMLAALISCNSGSQNAVPGGADAYSTTVQYVEHFYPRWLSYAQFKLAPANGLIGPDRMDPVYGAVVAPNDDTLYGSTIVDVRAQPVILTIPSTSVTYSLFTADVYGDVFDSGITAPGTYALTGPGWAGALPAGVTQVPLSEGCTVWIFRADKYTAAGQDETAAAQVFRSSLRIATLSDYLADPAQGSTKIVPVADFSPRYKMISDITIQNDPISYLKGLQAAVHNAQTPTLTSQEQSLSDRFDALFGDGESNTAQFMSGAQAAHAAVVNYWLSHTGPTNWIGLTDITTGSFGFSGDLERSAWAEYLQWGNVHSTAAYFQTFKDGSGNALDGTASIGYTLTFPAAQIPQTKRFWSLTAYTPDSITLIANSANKYLVASYTPGLVTAPDGSITIYLSQTQPAGAPAANWLPIPNGPFNVMLRDYGPLGTAAAGTYVPPPVTSLGPTPAARGRHRAGNKRP